MPILEATYTLVTPMLTRQDDPDATGLSVVSFRHALRSWWRMLAWSDGSYLRSQRAIRDAERAIFGMSDRGQAGFYLQLHSEAPRVLSPGERLTDAHSSSTGPGLAFLAYGAVAFDEDTEGGHSPRALKPLIVAPHSFRATLLFAEEPPRGMTDALKALGLMGGLGVRTRRGFGNITLESLLRKEHPEDRCGQVLYQGPGPLEAYSSALQKVFASDMRTLPSVPALSASTRLVMLFEDNSALALLDRIGERMARYREEVRREQSAPPRSAPRRPGQRVTERVPSRGYGPYSSAPPGEELVWAGSMSSTRQALTSGEDEASPHYGSLFFHVHALEGGRYCGVVGIFPTGDDVTPPRRFGRSVPSRLTRDRDDTALWDFLHGRFGPQHHKRGERFFPNPLQLHPFTKPIHR